MKKKLKAELMSMAHSILKLKEGDDVGVLKNKAYQVYEKLTILSFIEDFVRETPQNTKTVEELVGETFLSSKKETLEQQEKEKKSPKNSDEGLVANIDQSDKVVLKSELLESDLQLFSIDTKEELKTPPNLQTSLEKEFVDEVSLDVATDIFENATRVPTKSINDTALQQQNLHIDLNDRIAFVKHLFDESHEDFNRVVSQLNTMPSEQEALSFLKMIKKEYHWAEQETYEDRLIMLIQRKFN